MRTSDLQSQLLDIAIVSITSASEVLRNKTNRNAYRRLNIERNDGLADAIAFYETILGNVSMHWDKGEGHVQIILDDLDDAWDDLFNVVGDTLINHELLETARNALEHLHEHLEAKLKSPIGTNPDSRAKSAIRAFMVAMSNMHEELISEISTPPPQLPKSTQQSLVKKKLVALVKGYAKITRCKNEEAIDAVSHVLWKELSSLSITVSKNNLRQLCYSKSYKSVDACSGEKLVQEGIISEEDYAKLNNIQ